MNTIDVLVALSMMALVVAAVVIPLSAPLIPRVRRMGIIKQLLCNHDYVWVRNIYGDEINAAGGNRSIWRCRKCSKSVLSRALVDENIADEIMEMAEDVQDV